MDESYLDLLLAQQEQTPVAEEMVPADRGGIWVVADRLHGSVAAVTLEALSAARDLAGALGAYVYAVLLGDGVADLSPVLYQAGADEVHIADHPALGCYALGPYAGVLFDAIKTHQPEVVIFGATTHGQELAARLAQRTGGGLIEHVTDVSLDEVTRSVLATFPVYDGAYYETAACPEDRPQFLTVEPGAFVPRFLDASRRGAPVIIDVEPAEPAARVVEVAHDFVPPPVPLSQALVIVAAGRQAGDFELVKRLAIALGGRVAGDRGARDAGWIGPEQVVDVRGMRVGPKVYVAVGVRGDTFHNAAVEEADFILAIHPDAEAPIFQIADLCLQADPAEFLPELLKALN